MCGIVGYIGPRQAHPVLLSCLERLEYRGYDSCGVAVASDGISIVKDAVRVKVMAETFPRLEGTTGIAHTRWASHGAPSKLNSHPQSDCKGEIAVVHNGVISNHSQLKKQLIEEGHVFTSETDTEVIPHLIEKYYRGDLLVATEKALDDIEGSYAIIALVKGDPGLVIARKDSPLIIGLGDRENFIASDVPAILEYTDRVIYLEDGDVGYITAGEVKLKRNGKPVVPEEQKVLWTLEEANKSGYEHFLLKEIHETPKVIRNTLAEFNTGDGPESGLELVRENSRIPLMIIAIGTSYYASLTGKYILEELLDIPVRVEIASEFNYYSHTPQADVTLALTQSGETADTLKSMKKVKEAGGNLIAVTNVVGSTASRLANSTIYTHAGPEISVAATKTFTAQLLVMYRLAMSQSNIDARRLSELHNELRQMPNMVQQVLDYENIIMEHARFLSGFDNVLFIGRGVNYPLALEGALKLKEISYIHAEGYAAGETKHGPIALLGKDVPVVAIVARDNTYEAMLTNIKEAKTRGSTVIAISDEEDSAIKELADYVITVPKVDVIFSPIVNVVALQLLAYYTARERGCPIDFPRNLAKSVTIE